MPRYKRLVGKFILLWMLRRQQQLQQRQQQDDVAIADSASKPLDSELFVDVVAASSQQREEEDKEERRKRRRERRALRALLEEQQQHEQEEQRERKSMPPRSRTFSFEDAPTAIENPLLSNSDNNNSDKVDDSNPVKFQIGPSSPFSEDIEEEDEEAEAEESVELRKSRSGNDLITESMLSTSTPSTSRKPRKKKSSGSYLANLINPTYKSRSYDFKRLFKQVEDERLIVDYSCALQKDILVHGRLYATKRHLCFYANIFRWETSLVIRWVDVVAINREKTALVIPNAIQVT